MSPPFNNRLVVDKFSNRNPLYAVDIKEMANPVVMTVVEVRWDENLSFKYIIYRYLDHTRRTDPSQMSVYLVQ